MFASKMIVLQFFIIRQNDKLNKKKRSRTSKVKNLIINEDLSQKARPTVLSENNEDFRSLSLSKRHVCLKTCKICTAKVNKQLCISIREDISCKNIKWALNAQSEIRRRRRLKTKIEWKISSLSLTASFGRKLYK